jgi:bla regulator protein blaR1
VIQIRSEKTRGDEMIMKLMKSGAALLLLTFCCVASRTSAIEAASGRIQKEARSSQRVEHSIRTEDHSWSWRHVDDDKRLEVTIRGRVEFADDYTDIKSIEDGGSIRVIDESGAVHRKFEATATAGGIQRSYWVNGQSQQVDQTARTWLAKVLDDTVRQGGYDARPRVQRILRESGPNGVLREITRLKGDYVKRIYFDELIKNGNLNDESIRQVLRQATAELQSDYEKAQLLVQISENYLVNDSQREIYLEGVNTLHSDYEKGRALGALLKKGNLTRENMLFVMRSVSHISSDYERAQILIRIAAGFPLDDPARRAYLESVATLKSDYEKGRVLAAFLKKGEAQKEDVLFVVKSATGVSTDYEKAQLLIKIADNYTLDDPTRVAFMDAVATMHSDYEKGRVLSTLLKKGGPQRETLLFTVKSASSISSDYEKAQLLIRVAAASSGDETVRAALIDSARTIHSEYERGRVLNAVFK